MDEDRIWRVKGGECLKLATVPGWGERLVRAPDPGVEPAPFAGVRATLAPEHRMSAVQWQAWLALAWELCQAGAGEEREVGILLARSAAPPHAAWRLLVPRQTVGAAALTYDLSELADLVTGERFAGIPVGWALVGSVHSHNEMAAFHSGTDIRDEAGVPGLHGVVGRINRAANTYAYCASLTEMRTRYPAELADYVDLASAAGAVVWSRDVLALIETRAPVVYSLPTRGTRPASWLHGNWDDDDRWYGDLAYGADAAREPATGGAPRALSRAEIAALPDSEQSAVLDIEDACLRLSRASLGHAFAMLADAEEMIEADEEFAAEFAADDAADAADAADEARGSGSGEVRS